MKASRIGVTCIIGADGAVIAVQEGPGYTTGGLALVPHCADIAVVAWSGVGRVQAACIPVAEIIGTGIPVGTIRSYASHTVGG